MLGRLFFWGGGVYRTAEQAKDWNGREETGGVPHGLNLAGVVDFRTLTQKNKKEVARNRSHTTNDRQRLESLGAGHVTFHTFPDRKRVHRLALPYNPPDGCC
ncbi:unnamed protein product [Discosporangium mesarthrocarpum]